MCEYKTIERAVHIVVEAKIGNLILRGFNLLVESLCKARRTHRISEGYVEPYLITDLNLS